MFKKERDHIRKGCMEEVAFEKGLKKPIGFQLAEMRGVGIIAKKQLQEYGHFQRMMNSTF